MKKFFFSILCWICAGAIAAAPNTQAFGKRKEQSALISSIRLLTNPEKYDGKRVFLDGFVVTGSDRCFLFASESDALRFRMTSAFMMSFEGSISLPTKATELLDGKWVCLEGVFRDLKENEVAGAGGGYIEAISFVMVLGEIGGKKE
jgi:hypothetical protein